MTSSVKPVYDGPLNPLYVALRTYSLCLSLALGPALLPVILGLHPESFRSRARVFLRALSREIRPTGFAWAITIAAGGGAALQRLWDLLGPRCTHQWAWVRRIHSEMQPYQRTFIANAITSTIAVTLLRWRRRRRAETYSPTLDLTLFFLVRALDAFLQAFLARRIAARVPLSTPSDNKSEQLAKKVATRLDALVFWASSARIMWCFFYQPQRLPRSYVKWINSLANVDTRLLEVLRALRDGSWSYIHGSSTRSGILGSLAEELGYPSSWGDCSALPAYGGNIADEAWKQLGVDGRNGVGGLPCELVHCGIGAGLGLSNSCVANAAIRAAYGFVEALVIYLPVHFLPILLTKPNLIVRLHRAIPTLLSVIRSAAFLSTFVSSYWFAVCFTRTLVLARLFPAISHDVWDGPTAGTLAGSLVCGASIWIENAKRRGEMALYVLPRALRASMPEKWLCSRHPAVQSVECLTFILSLASLLTFSAHQPESLRGLSRWASTFIMKATKKMHKRESATYPPVSVDDPDHREA